MTETPKSRLAIVAGSWMQSCRYAQENHLPADAWIFAQRPDDVVRGALFVLVGTYKYNRLWPEIEQALLRLDCRKKANSQ
jgi:hypothetical protein